MGSGFVEKQVAGLKFYCRKVLHLQVNVGHDLGVGKMEAGLDLKEIKKRGLGILRTAVGAYLSAEIHAQ